VLGRAYHASIEKQREVWFHLRWGFIGLLCMWNIILSLMWLIVTLNYGGSVAVAAGYAFQ